MRPLAIDYSDSIIGIEPGTIGSREGFSLTKLRDIGHHRPQGRVNCWARDAIDLHDTRELGLILLSPIALGPNKHSDLRENPLQSKVFLACSSERWWLDFQSALLFQGDLVASLSYLLASFCKASDV